TLSKASLSGGQELQNMLQTTTLSAMETERGSLDVSDIAEVVMPSIVSITNKSVQEIRNYFSMFGYGGQSQLMETESAGSGFIIGKNADELLIVTNCHVVENADTISVCFVDNQAYEANIKGTDSANDLAVIAIPLDSISSDTMAQIKIAAIGDSDALKVGEQVVAIGNALGYGQSVTTGIVSAKNRSINNGNSMVNTSTGDEEMPTYIQTDAAINPGNSGGALVNMNGEVVGINSAKMSGTEVEGMGYAIPISRVSDIIETLMNETTRAKVEESRKSNIGISGVTVDESVSQIYGIPTGVFIADVTAGGAAEEAGIAKGDVITEFDGRTVTGVEELQEILQYYAAGETVEITLKVPDTGEYSDKTVSLTLGHAADSESKEETETLKMPVFGIYR
ncbi:MAG: trypsin-like peptidase domain-containing protein, partial [Lachnospiraceae bacterium]|nr:trypsin-like peptidase domain-containing protein [Lachnospiraceae bacterium]